MIEIAAVFVGTPSVLATTGGENVWSGISKHPVAPSARLWLSELNLSGDGQAVKVLGSATYEYYAGPATAGDTHVYRVQATDGSGNAGPFSDAYTGVPDLRGLSQQQARDVLGSRGFSVGTIGNAGSGGAVGSQNPVAPAYAPVGSAVDFSLSTAVRTSRSASGFDAERDSAANAAAISNSAPFAAIRLVATMNA